MRGGAVTLRSEYEQVLYRICRTIQINEYGFVYAVAKDVLKWNNLSPKKYILAIINIGNMYIMDDKAWGEYVAANNYVGITKEELKAFMES